MGPIDLWLAEQDENREKRLAVWQRVAAGRITVHTAAGDHYSLLREPNVRTLTQALRNSFETSDGVGDETSAWSPCVSLRP